MQCTNVVQNNEAENVRSYWERMELLPQIMAHDCVLINSER